MSIQATHWLLARMRSPGRIIPSYAASVRRTSSAILVVELAEQLDTGVVIVPNTASSFRQAGGAGRVGGGNAGTS